MAERIPPAARTLVRQVTEARPDVKWGVSGTIDGLRRYRTIRFEDAAEWLDIILEAHADRRIDSWYSENGDLYVTFVADVRADRAQPFQIEDALKVVEEEPEPEAKEDEPKKPAKKAARKRAAKKAD